MNDTFSLKKTPEFAGTLREELSEADFSFESAPYAFFRARSSACIITFYQSGKLVLQGKGAKHWLEHLDPSALSATTTPFEEALQLHPNPPPDSWIGVDESGKGDYFGSLVIASACVNRNQVELLAELGVADSKKLSDKKIRKLARTLYQFIPFDVIRIGPEKYNILYKKFRNLNTLLAWGHARSIANLKEKVTCNYALCDQFGSPELIQNALNQQGIQIRLDQRHRAETDPAVAVASIMARASVLKIFDRMENYFKMTFPKGAGPPVIAAGKRFLKTHGTDKLAHVAKLHFQTTFTIKKS